MEKWGRYECEVAIAINRSDGTLVFDDLNVEGLKLSDYVEITGLKMESENKITAKMVVDPTPDDDRKGDNFIRDINKLLNLIGVKIRKNGLGTFFRNGKKIGYETKSSSSAEVCIANYQQKIRLDKIFTSRFSSLNRIKEVRSDFQFICSTLKELNESTGICTPILADQLINFLFEKDDSLKNLLSSGQDYSNSAKELMEEGNELFEKETGFRIGDVLDRNIKENKRYKYSKINERAFALIRKLNMKRNKARAFILMHAVRNMAAHFIDVSDFDRLVRLKKFISSHAEDYKEPLLEVAFEWLGINWDFKWMTWKTITSTD